MANKKIAKKFLTLGLFVFHDLLVSISKTRPKKTLKGSADGQYSSSHYLLLTSTAGDMRCLYLMIRVKTYMVEKLSSPQRA